MKRFAVYLRISDSRAEDRASLRVTQPTACAEYVQRQGGKITVIAKDAQSGLEDDRSGWQAIAEAARRGLIDAVVVWKMDRFGRELADVFPYLRDLDRLGVELHSTSEGSERFVLELMAVVAKQESRRTSDRVRENQVSMVRQGKWVGRPPLGYDAEPSEKGDGTRLVANDKAHVVRFVFRDYIESRSLNLTRKEAKERFGVTLSRQRLHRMLRNPLYIGRVIFGRMEASKVRHRRGKRPEAEWIEATGKHEPLIDQQTWAAVQAILDANAQAHASYGPDASYLLTGLAFCAACGGRMRGQKLGRYSKRTGLKIGQAHAYLHDADNECRPRTRAGPRADNAVKAALMRVPLFPEAEMLAATQLVETALTGGDTARRLEKKHRAERARLEREYEALLTAQAEAESERRRRGFDKLLGQKEAAIDAIDQEVSSARSIDRKALQTVAAMLQAPPFDWAELQRTDDPALWRIALDRFVDRVELGEQTSVVFKPHLGDVLAAVERGDKSLPKPLRAVVIRKAESALKLLADAQKQAEQEAWQLDKETRGVSSPVA